MLEAIHRWENEGGALQAAESTRHRLGTVRRGGRPTNEARPTTLALSGAAAHPVTIARGGSGCGVWPPEPGDLPPASRDGS
jgi:hypothetical protein